MLNHSPRIVTNGLVLCLDAANRRSYPGSGTVWTDLSGNGNNGTLINGPAFSSANGGVINFDGSNDYVDCGNLLFAQSFSLFIFFNTTKTSLQIIAGKYTGAAYDFWFGTQNDGTLRFSISMNGKIQPTSTKLVNDGRWHLGTAIYNLSSLSASVYVDGIHQQSLTGTVPFLEPNPPFAIGIFPGLGLNYSGNIASAQVYNRALSASEVAQNYLATKKRFGL